MADGLVTACPSPGPGFLPYTPPPRDGTWLWPVAQLKEKVSLAACRGDPRQLHAGLLYL